MSHSIKNSLLQDKTQLLNMALYALHNLPGTPFICHWPCSSQNVLRSHTSRYPHRFLPVWIFYMINFYLSFQCRFRYHFLHEFFHNLPFSSWGSVTCPSKCASMGYCLLCSTHRIALKCLFVDLFRWSISTFRNHILLTIKSPVYIVWKTSRVLIS